MARAIHLARPLLRIEHPLARECMAEFLGVFVLILITNGATAQAVTSLQTKGGYFTMYLGGALAVTVAIYVSGGVSGGHLNPAYTLSMCLLGRFQWRKMPLFVFIQILASFAAAGTAYALYYDAIQQYCNGSLTVTGPRETASIFATYPADYLTLWNGFLDQVIGTAMLLVGILAIVDSKNKPVPKGLEPLLVGLLVLSIGLSMGSNCGYPINPARDLGPRLFTFVAGWGPEVFSAGNNWWWIPIVAPLLGAVIGSVVYEVFVEFHHPDNPSEPLASSTSKDHLYVEKWTPETKKKKLEMEPVFTVDTYMEGCTERSRETEGYLSHRL
ncbi:aquaporin-10 isoform X2 [Ambystoma mexicanum]|uniref:aquaporin-10 isoform X2 n=1 Tax=Ambystoma mexicanum TaxID=8296 RepID=UPI0037E7C25C